MKNNWAITILIIICIWISIKNGNLKSDIERLRDETYECTYALGQANSNIEEAKWYAWESYEDMGYALESLETVDY